MQKILIASLALLVAGCSNDETKPLTIAAGTIVTCAPEQSLGSVNEQSYKDGQPKLSQSLKCTVESNEAVPKKTTFVGQLAGALNEDVAPGRAVIVWRELHLAGETVSLNDADTFESREWYDGNLRVIFKRDLTIK